MTDLAGFAIVSGIVTCVIVSVPLSIGVMRRMSQPRPPVVPSPEIVARLERMEQGIEAIATEVERISEGQRFTAKLLSDSRGSRERVPPSPLQPE